MIIQQTEKQQVKRAEKIAKEIHISLLREEGRPVYLNTSGSSMYPFVKGGDILTMSPVKEQDIVVGDVVGVDNLDKMEAWFCVHRVVRILSLSGKRIYVTKGDANREGLDEPIGFDRIVGRLTGIERNGLKIGLERAPWTLLNRHIARISLRYPYRLRAFAPYISLLIEWKFFLAKARRRFSKLDEPLYNSEELLLILARMDLPQGLVKRAKELIKNGVDWDFFENNGLKSGIAFLLYKSLTKVNYPDVTPKYIVNKMKAGYVYAIPGTTGQYRETRGVIKALMDRNIPVVPLKGPFLSRRIYGDIAARGMSTDIDLLIKDEDRKAAREALEAEGYVYGSGSGMGDTLGQCVFRKKGAYMIDLHWQINPVVSSPERMNGFWSEAGINEDDGLRYYEFSDEALLLQLSVHLVDSAHLSQLRYVCEINELLTKRANTLDWDGLVVKAREWKLSGALYTAIILSRKLFNTHVPDKALAGLRPGLFKRAFIGMFTDVRIILHQNSRRRAFLSRFLKYMFFQLIELASFKECREILFPPKERMGGKTHLQRVAGALTKLIPRFGKKRDRGKKACQRRSRQSSR